MSQLLFEPGDIVFRVVKESDFELFLIIQVQLGFCRESVRGLGKNPRHAWNHDDPEQVKDVDALPQSSHPDRFTALSLLEKSVFLFGIKAWNIMIPSDAGEDENDGLL